MSWLSKGLHAVGGIAEKAAPYIGLIPGVGTIAGGAIGGIGALAHGDGLSGALKYGAMGAAGGAAGGGLRSAITGAVANHGGGGAPQVTQNGVPISLSDINPNVATDASPDEGGGFLSSVGGYLKNALGGVNPINAALGAAGVVNAGQLGAKANKYANEAYGNAQQSYAERAGLRKAGMEGMLNPVTPDTSYLSKIRSNNAYAGGQ